MNNFILQLVAGLSKTKSKQQIKSDAKSLGDMYVKLIGNLDMPKTRKAIKAQLKGLNNLTFNITPNVNTKGVQTATKQAINNAQRVANSNKVHLNFDTNKQQLINQIKILGRNNNKLFSDQNMTAKYNQLLNSASVAKSTGELKTLRDELSAFKTELVATNNAGMTWGSKFKESIKSYAKFFSGASMIYALSNQVRNAATEAKTLDDSLVNLQKVTDEISDRDALYKYFDKSLSKAQELNIKVGSLIDAVTEFKKLGWDLDEAELGAKWANILSNVGDVDIDTAIGSIKTSIASFDEIGGYGNDQMDKKLEAYTDLINNMSNKYSIDADGLAESIRLSAGTLTEAHMSIEQAATMFATANKYYNDPSYLGNTAKIGSLRMRASSGDTDAIEELQEMGEEVDDLATATSNLREKLMALTGVDIMEDEHTFKSYYDQLYEISQVMDKLDDTSRANVLETMFGKSRSAAGAALLSGMKESASAYEDAINSAGSATEEYQTWMTSADAACQRFSNTLTETYQGIINGNTVRDLANLGSAVLEFANNWGIVEGTLKGVIALGIGKFLTTGTMALITATKQVEQYGKALQMASNVPNGNLSARFQALKSIAQATSTLTTEQLRNVLATNTLTQADRVRILQMQGMTKEMALQKLAEMNLTQATNAQTAANTASTASTFSLKAAMIGLGATLKSVFLSNPVGIVLMGISLGVSAVTSAVSKHNQAVEEARQKAKEAADNANTLGDEIAELANKYIQLSDAVKTDASAKEDLMTTQTELLKKLGLEGESIDDLIAKYGSLSNAIKQASIDSLKNQQTDLIAGVNAAKEELMDVAKDNFWGTNNIISASGEETVKAFKELEKAGVIDSGSYGTGGGQLVLIGDDTVEGALENYKKLEDAVNALRDSKAFTADELSDNSLFNSIYSRYSEMKESVEAYNSSIDNLNENLAQQTMLTALQGNELPKTEEDFNKFKQELIDTAVASKQFIGNEKEITDAINNYLSTVPEFEGYYSIPLENELDKVDELLNQEDFSKSFKQAWKDLDNADDDSGMKNTKKDLTTLAESGKLTRKTFEATEGAKTWLSQIEIDADVAIKKINDLVDSSKQLNSLKSSIKSIQDAYADKRDNGVAGADTLSGMESEFGKLKSWNEFKNTLGSTTSTLADCQEAQNKLASEYVNSNNFLSQLTEENKDYYTSQLKDLGIKNAQEVVTTQLENKAKSLNLAYSALSKEQKKTVKSGEELAEMSGTDIAMLLGEANGSKKARIELAKLAYQTTNWADLDATQTIEQLNNIAKAAGIAANNISLLQDVNNNPSKYQGSSLEAAARANGMTVDEYSKKMAKDQVGNKLNKKGKKTKTKINIDLSLPKVTGSGSGKGSGSSSSSSKVFDWIEVRLKRLEDKVKKTVDNINDYATKETKNNLFEKAKSQYDDLLKGYETAAKKYKKKLDRINLSSSLKKKIQSGDYSIQRIKSSTKDKDILDAIDKYQEYWDKYTSARDNIAETKNNKRELIKKQLEDDISDLEDDLELLQYEADKTQSRIEKNETKGFAATKNDYKEQINNSKKQITKWNDEKKAYQSYLKNNNIAKTSDEYQDIKQKIRDIDKNISDAEKNQLEWNKSISELPYQSLEKFKNILDAISSRYEKIISFWESQGHTKNESQITKQISIGFNGLSQLKKERDEKWSQINKTLSDKGLNSSQKKQFKALYEGMREGTITVDQFYKSISKLGISKKTFDSWDGLRDKLQEVDGLDGDILDKQAEIENNYDDLLTPWINSIQDLIDKINDLNDAQSKAIELEKLQQALQSAKQNKKNLIYHEDYGFNYEADNSAVKEAQDNLDDYYNQEQLDTLNKILDWLNDHKDDMNFFDKNGKPLYKTVDEAVKAVTKGMTEGMSESVKKMFDSLTFSIDKNGKITASVPKYATGTKYAKGGMSIVGDKGAELRLLNSGDQILPHNVTDNLWKFGVNPTKMILDNIQIPDMSNLVKNTGDKMVNNNVSIGTVTLPNINDLSKANDVFNALAGLSSYAHQQANKR